MRLKEGKEHAIVNKKYECQCGKVYTRSDSLRRHVRTKQCGKRTNDSKQDPENEDSRKMFGCDQCGKRYTRKDTLNRHVKLVHSNSTLLRHLTGGGKRLPIKKDVDQPLSHATHEGGRQHKCLVCTKAFKKLGRLVVHSQKHNGEKPHQCPMCSKRFR